MFLLHRQMNFIKHSTTRNFTQAIIKKLTKALDRRIEEDYEIYKLDDGIPIFLQLNELEIEDYGHTTKVILRKTINDLNIEVNFEAQNLMSPSDFEKLNELTKSKVNTKMSEFNVFVTNPTTKAGFYVDCSSYNSEIIIKNIMFSSDMKIFENPYASGLLYQGPNIEKQAKPYLPLFISYLETLGITSNLISFIESYTIDKDYRLYLAWLSKVRKLF
ncbi:hypothetical protein SteCoe_6402 [Stentor coeruleus]|uniref:Uncharacterized protein n=1 Tax=Stentor coeruleus TaxID=5963 RepID=A0A1R2CQ52_9CILI|nr:hypothetical protein SteCoe_6402 [Stentor coeruleus]